MDNYGDKIDISKFGDDVTEELSYSEAEKATKTYVEDEEVW